MNGKKVLATFFIWGVIYGFPIINGQSILAWLNSTIAGFAGPLLGSGFVAYLPVVSGGATFVVLFFGLDKISATKPYSVQAAN